MNRSTPERLLYLSPVPLSSFAQRPHHFVHWFHQRYKAPVFWIDPGPSRLVRLSDWPRLISVLQRSMGRLTGQKQGPPLGPVWQHETWLQYAKAQVLPFEPYGWGRKINQVLWQPLLKHTDLFVNDRTLLVMGKPCALSLMLSQRYPNNRCVFDAMDHMPGFCTGISRQWMLQAQDQLAHQAHTLWASSHALAENHTAHAHKTNLVCNALTLPPRQTVKAATTQRTTVMGYLGVIDKWFDWRLVIDLARQNPQAKVKIIGPVHKHPPEPLPCNVQCLPAVPQHQIYEAMADFDIGLIPFANNELTHYVDPVKYYEYRAMGLPVLTTRFGEMSRRNLENGVHFWDQLTTGQISLQSILQNPVDENDRLNFCEENTWQARFDAHAQTLISKFE